MELKNFFFAKEQVKNACNKHNIYIYSHLHFAVVFSRRIQEKEEIFQKLSQGRSLKVSSFLKAGTSKFFCVLYLSLFNILFKCFR